MRQNTITVLILASALVLTACGITETPTPPPPTATRSPPDFSGELAFEHVAAQDAFGPRWTGTDAWRQTGDYIGDRLQSFGWAVESQAFIYRGKDSNGPERQVRNIIGRLGQTGEGGDPYIIIGAHYDTRIYADKDPENPTAPVPGANDGGSGVGVLLELARVLGGRQANIEIWLAFFDAEDNGRIDDWEWLVGSRYMAQNLETLPDYMILVDMVGDSDNRPFYWEGYSDHELSGRLWDMAADLGFGGYFVPEVYTSILDDHVPFIERGIPAVDIIGWPYAYHHRTTDTLDKVSAASLERVGLTLQAFLEETGAIQ
jgi:glutaminyl-peptide cyclotransferase